MYLQSTCVHNSLRYAANIFHYWMTGTRKRPSFPAVFICLTTGR